MQFYEKNEILLITAVNGTIWTIDMSNEIYTPLKISDFQGISVIN